MSSKKVLAFVILNLLIVNLAFANSILTQYRQMGLITLKKQLDLELTKVRYWEEYLKGLDTSFGFIESYSSILICNKEKSTLSIYKRDKDQKFSIQKKYHAFTGQAEGDKVKEGDLKTPIGLYRLTKKISKLDSFYGPLAFVTSYPNIYDKLQGKNGSGIWIHGLPIKQKRDEFTKGCIAINNLNLKGLDKNIDINSTLLIISNSQAKKNISKKKLSYILAALYKWRYSWIYNETKNYLNFYSQEFIRYDGMNYEKFEHYKTRVFNKMEIKHIIFNNINIIPYPNQENIFQITFKEFYTSSSFKFEGNKTLIVHFNKKNFSILTEK